MPFPKPMASKPLSREYRIYLALWRKAYHRTQEGLEADPIIVRAPTYAHALSLRSGLYKAIRPYRHGEAYDDELFAASERLVITANKTPQPDGTFTLAFTPRKTLAMLEADLEALGLSEEDLLLPEESSISRDLNALIQPTSDLISPAAPRTNPFYTRED